MTLREWPTSERSWLVRSLGGNSYTAVVATIHPMPDYSEECLSSLQFANRCRNVQNQPRINYIGEWKGSECHWLG
jgi:hypothetical protein